MALISGGPQSQSTCWAEQIDAPTLHAKGDIENSGGFDALACQIYPPTAA